MFLVIFLFLVVVFLYKKCFEDKSYKKYMEIPGPPGLPVIGHLLKLFEKPEQKFKSDRIRNKTYYPIYKMYTINLKVVVLLTAEDVELVLANMKHNGKHQLYDLLHNWLGTGLLTSIGEKWQTRRKILTPAFHFKILQDFIKVFNEETNHLVKEFSKHCDEPFIDVKPYIVQFTLASLMETTMGTPLDISKNNHTLYKKAVDKMGRAILHRYQRPWLIFPSIYKVTSQGKQEAKNIDILHSFTDNVIRKRVNDHQNNLDYSNRKKLAMLDLLLKAKYENGSIDDQGIREEVDTFMFEGHDTTSVAICYILVVLANEPQFQDEIYNEIHDMLGDNTPTLTDLNELKYMERCIKECLRLYPSVPFIGRVAGEDIHTATGYTIPKGYAINMPIYDIHRDPKVYENPTKFDPDRFLPKNINQRNPFAFIPFSAGPRNCIGQKFAILELKAALCGILRAFKLEAVDKTEDIKFLTDMVLRCEGPLRVKFVKRK